MRLFVPFLATLRTLTQLSCAALPLLGCDPETSQPEPVPEPEPEPQPEPEPTAPLTLQDVSVLYPLPASVDASGYLTPATLGARGELLPRDVYDAIPTFPVQPSQGLDYDRMRVVSLRFDDCHALPAGGCEPQIRLVMQPLTGSGLAQDSALHLFYSLDSADLDPLVSELVALKALAPEVVDGPLDVHAALVAQGVEGAYGTGLQELVLSRIGEANLTRITFFLRAPPAVEVWFFGGFERRDGELEVMDIVDLGQSNQQVIRRDVSDGYDYEVNPLSSFAEVERPLLTTAAAEAATDEERAAAFQSLLRTENPNLFTPDDLSCTGCHLATFVLEETRARFGLEDASFADDVYDSELDLSVRGGAKTTASSLRAFGYFKRDAMISQRVVHESAGVVSRLRAREAP
jgi:hypothetical protein